MAMQASDGARRLAAAVRTAGRAGPRWESSRVLTSAAAGSVAVLAITGVVALSTTGSAAPRARDAAATTTKPAKPHYLLPIAALVQQGAVPPPTLTGDNSTIGVPNGTAARPTTPATTPTPGSSAITTYRGATGTMTPAGIATLALVSGCSAAQAPTATAVAMAESGGSPSAQGDVSLMTAVWDWSAGLWQIRGLRSERGSGALRDSVANQRASTNAAAMYVISSGCSNWSPWTTYTRGLYAGYLGVAQQAVDYVVDYRRTHGQYPPVASPDPTAVIPVATGGGPAAPAAAQSSTARTVKPKATRTPAAPKASGSATPTTRAARPTAGSSTSKTAKPSPTPSRSTSTKPLLPLPTISNIVPTNILPSPPCLLGVLLC